MKEIILSKAFQTISILRFNVNLAKSTTITEDVLLKGVLTNILKYLDSFLVTASQQSFALCEPFPSVGSCTKFIQGWFD